MNPHDHRPKGLDLVHRITRFRRRGPIRGRNYVPLAVLAIAAVFFVHDLYLDFAVEHESFSHVLIEGGVFTAVLLALAVEVMRVLELSDSVATTRDEIARLRKHLGEVIDEEFERWDLSASEKEIATLLVKGFSMREIADYRGVKEKSVRQQATGIYAKARVNNRYELTAHFIEDLLTPVDYPT